MRPEGTYKARAVSMDLGASKNGTEYVAVLFDLEAGGQEVWFGYLTDKTISRTLEALRLCGWEGDDLSDPRGISKNEVYLVIEHEEYEGKVRAKVQWVNATGHGPMMFKSGPEAKAMAAKYRAKVIAERQKQGQVGATGTDDDIPF